MRSLIIFLAALFLTGTANAEVINGCVKNNNGTLRIVADPADCNSREMSISWNQEGAPGADAEVLHVFDVSGRSLGIAGMDEPGIVWVFVPGIGETKARRDGGINALRVLVYYSGAGCTGDAFVKGIDDDTAGQIVTPRDTRFFVVETGVPLTDFQHESVRGPGGTCDGSTASGNGLPVTEVTAEDLGLPWPGPLYVAPAP